MSVATSPRERRWWARGRNRSLEPYRQYIPVCMCVCVSVRVCVRACVRARAPACRRAGVYAYMHTCTQGKTMQGLADPDGTVVLSENEWLDIGLEGLLMGHYVEAGM